MNTPIFSYNRMCGMVAATLALLFMGAPPQVAQAQPGPKANPKVVRTKPLPAMWWNSKAMDVTSKDRTYRRDRVFLRDEVSSEPYVYDAIFEDDLFLQTDLVLPGIGSAQSITFPTPLLWDLREGTELRIRLDHSSALIPERSGITISVNDVNLQSFRLDESNTTDAELVIPLPLEILRDYNTLKFEVTQHYTDDCEDPFDPSLWTKISRLSSLHMVYDSKPMDLDLLQYPLPFFDPQGYGPTFVEFVPPASPSAESLEALGVVAAGLGREVSYRPLTVGAPIASVNEATGNVILVGTTRENPDIGSLLGSQVSALSAGQGMIAMVPNPARPHTTILIVTGSSGAGVLAAAKALTSSARHEVLSGKSSAIVSMKEVKAAELRAREHFVPPETNFTLEDLGINDVTVRGFFSSPIRIPVRSLPDLQFIEGQQVMRVYYSYGAQLHTASSTMEIRWNNISLESVPLDNPDGENRAFVDINIPVEVMAPYNNLEVVFNLFPRNYGPCDFKTDRHIWGTVYSDTSFSMPRYHYAEMPDLGKLQYGYYPFGLRQDLDGTILVTSDNPNSTDLIYTSIMAAELGRKTRAERVVLKTKKAGSLSQADKSGNHLIVLNSGSGNSLVEELRSKRPLDILGRDKTLRSSEGPVLEAMDPNSHATVEQLLSPFGREKVVLIVQGFTQEFMEGAIRLISDPVLLSQISGDIALLGMDDNLQAVDTGSRAAFGSKPLTLKARDWGREHRWMMVFILIASIFLLYLIIQFLIGSTGPNNGGGGNGGGGRSRSEWDDSRSESRAEDESGFEEDFFTREEEDYSARDVSAVEAAAPQRRAPPRRVPPRRGTPTRSNTEDET